MPEEGESLGPGHRECGDRFHGGERSRAQVEHLLGLDAAPKDWRVALAAWYDDHLLVLVGSGTSYRLVLLISDAVPGEDAWIRTQRLHIVYKGHAGVPESIDGLVRGRAPDRMGSMTAADLRRLVEEDPECRPLPGTGEDEDMAVTNLLTTWAGRDSYAEFFAVGEIQRGQLDSMDLSGAFRFVQHCEAECLMQSPHATAPLVTAVEYPWDDRIRNIGVAAPSMPLEPDSISTTELTDKDVIFGNPGRLRDVLDHAVSAPNPRRKIIFFSNTCVPMVTGEDVESVVRQYARKSKVPLVYLDVTPKSMYDVFRNLLYDSRRKAEEHAPPPDEMAVNLIGFPEGAFSEGVVELLGAAGIRSNTHLIPNFGVDRIKALPRAAVNVFYPNVVWTNHYEHLKADTRLRCISPQAPYGWEGSLQWLRSVCEAVGLSGDDADRAFQDVAGRYRRQWDEVRREAKGLGVCMVVRAEELAHLTDPSTTWGVPLASFLEEAGFHVEVLLKVGDREQAVRSAREVQALFRDPGSLSVKGFNSFETLRKRLKESDVGAVLSYHFFDWRITEAGKNRFSLQVFETGLPGAVRTVQRLVGICNNPFYRRYRDHLARREDGAIVGKRGKHGAS